MKIRNWNKIKIGTLLIITWDDIVENDKWLSDEEAQKHEPITCKNVGWFVNHDENNIRITWSVAGDGDKAITVIPKGVIRDVKRINYSN